MVGLPRRIAGRATREPLAAKCILLIDGDSRSRDALRHMLEAQNFHIPKLPPTEAGLQSALSQIQPDVILLHPQAGSDQLLSWTRKFSANRAHPPILLVISPHEIATALEGLRCGAYDYLIEPYTTEQMIAKIHRAVEFRELQEQNERYRAHLEQMIEARMQSMQRAMHQIERSYDVTLEALGDALDLKDAETEGHSKRVTAYTLALGRAVGLREPELRVVGRGAFLHDIGKMAIPDSILRKPGKLTPEEQAIMRTHSELGYQMLRKIPFLHDAAEIVWAHQEYFDGSGYPRRLRGEQIPMGARIFALADTLDAMTSSRPYRKATTLSLARKEILRCAGSQFDPAVVDVFVATPDELWHELRDGIMRDGRAFSPFGFTFGDGALSAEPSFQ
jgi:putative nucleotidyltransferase with HDIG domain